MANTLANLAKMSVTGTPGTGSITLSGAVSGYQTFAAAGVTNAATVTYKIDDGSNWELGTGTYTSSGTSLSRTTVTASSNGGSKISATSAAVVSIVVQASDIQSGVSANQLVRLDGSAKLPAVDGSALLNIPSPSSFDASVLTSGTIPAARLAAATLPSSQLSGTVPAANMPAFSGAITTSAGSTTTALATNAVTNTNIAAGAVAQSNLASNVVGTGPVFSNILSSAQSLSALTWTKCQLPASPTVDTNSGWNSANFRYVAPIAGLYHISFYITNSSTGTGVTYDTVASRLYVNGVAGVVGGNYGTNNTSTTFLGNYFTSTGSWIYALAANDYVELWGYVSATTTSGFPTYKMTGGMCLVMLRPYP